MKRNHSSLVSCALINRRLASEGNFAFIQSSLNSKDAASSFLAFKAVAQRCLCDIAIVGQLQLFTTARSFMFHSALLGIGIIDSRCWGQQAGEKSDESKNLRASRLRGDVSVSFFP
jgi:hypothetical protein